MRANEFTPNKLVIFDIDDTLVHTQTKVHVVKDGRVTKELNSHEFTLYKLQPGEQFDFENFRNAKEFFTNSKPIIPMMDQLKQDIATGNKVVMVTARADFDDRELFLDTFRKYGVDMNKVHVYRAGNMTGKMQTEEKKKIIIRNLLDNGSYTKAIMYDDAVPNLESFVELKKEYPQTKFYAWHVSLEGEASEYHRTNEDQSLEERRKKKRRVRHAAYGPGPFGGYGYYGGYSGDAGGGDGGGESIQHENWDDEEDEEKIVLIKSLQWPELVNKVSSAMKAMGWKGQRKDDGSFMFSTRGQLDDEWYIVVIDNRGNNMFTYALGTVEEGDPYIGEQESLPMTEASVSELMIAVREGFGLNEQGLAENFADGKNPQDKGDSKRHGVPTKASVSTLRKVAKQGGRKGQLAHWMANMKSGKAKKK
jgi:hypothetical protein